MKITKFLILTYAMSLNTVFSHEKIEKDADFPLLEGPYLGQKQPGVTPELFAPGVISLNGRFESAVSFSPDLDEIYFAAYYEGEETAIYFSKLEGNQWTPIKQANFTNGKKNGEMHPFVSPDGKRIYFTAFDTSFADEKIWYVNRLESSGIGDYPNKLRFTLSMISKNLRHGSAYFEPEELIGFVQKKSLFIPGEGYSYSDAGYLILGRLIEKASGQSYFELLQDRLLSPLGLDQIKPQDQSILPNITPGYQGGGSNLKKDGRMKFDPRSEWTGGGLVTNPTMLVQFFSKLGQGKILKPDSLKQMITSGWRGSSNKNDYYYGLGMFIDNQGKWLGHSGLWPGYRTVVSYYNSSGITVAVQTNRDGRVDMIKLISGISDLAMKTQN